MYDNEYARTVMSAAEFVSMGMKVSLITSFFLSIFIAGALSELFGAIRSLQIVVHMVMFNLVIPANYVAFNKVFFSIA